MRVDGAGHPFLIKISRYQIAKNRSERILIFYLAVAQRAQKIPAIARRNFTANMPLEEVLKQAAGCYRSRQQSALVGVFLML